jgi:RND family efflux transporter MFP subunit
MTVLPRRVFFFVVLLALVGGGVFFFFRQKSSGGPSALENGMLARENSPQAVAAFQVEKTTFTDHLRDLIGTIKGDTVELAFGGQEEPLMAIHVRVGQVVTKGRLLFELDHTRAKARQDQADVAYERAKKFQEAGAATAGDVQEARSAFDIAHRDYEDTFIHAPKSGTVSSIQKQVGETVARNDVIGVLVSNQDELKLETGVIEAHLDRVAQGQKAVVEIEALGDQEFPGEVQGVSREVTTTGRMGTVIISLPRSLQAKLRPGQSARCRIAIFEAVTFVIPIKAYDATEKGVYVIKNSSATFQLVTLGHATPQAYEVITGLSDGDLVIRDLLINPVKNGDAVTVEGETKLYVP